MAYTLVGTVVSTCDAAVDFTNNNSGANISGDDDFVQGTGAVGDKMSGSNELLVSDNLSGGAAGVYDFSSGGADEGAHFIGWLNTKTSINATTGLQIMFRNASGHEGSWYVMPAFFYKGGFITRVINPEVDFDTATTWTTTGNPAQLDDVSEMGFEFDMVATIMGNFNNSQVDQFTVGFGVRADAGTGGSPNTFEGVRSTDEDTNFWGWWSAVNGAFVGKGKLYVGPATGTATSVFVDSAFAVNWAEENVAAGFYAFEMRGANTQCDWTLANISAADSAVARWSLTLDSAMGSTTGGFTDTQGVYNGYDTLTLNQYAAMDGTVLIDGDSIIQNGADLDNLTVIEPTVLANIAHILSDDLGTIDGCAFNANSGNTGHAIEIDTIGTYTFNANQFPGFTTTGAGDNLVASSGPNNAMIYNNSGGLVTINVTGGGQTPVIRNGAGATTVVNNNTSVTLSGMRDLTEVRVYAEGTQTELAGIENATAGTADDRSFTFALGAAVAVDIAVFNVDWILPPNNRIKDFSIPALDTTIPVSQVFDRNVQ